MSGTYGITRKLFRTTSVPNETTMQKQKRMTKPANAQPGTSSHHEEVLDKRAKKRTPPAHVGPRTASHHEEALGGKKKNFTKQERLSNNY